MIHCPGCTRVSSSSHQPTAFTNNPQLSYLTHQELRAAPELMEHARAAAAEALSLQLLTPRLKAALVAYGFWVPGPGGGAAAAAASTGAGAAKGTGRSGVSGV